jgi:hypothetical protein
MKSSIILGGSIQQPSKMLINKQETNDEGFLLSKEVIVRGIKILDIGYVTFIYFYFAFFISVGLDSLYGEFDPKEEDKKSMPFISIEIAAHIWLLGVITYIVKNIVELIPYPLDGISGFDHNKLKELHQPAIFSVVMVIFQRHLQAKLTYFYNRLVKPPLTSEKPKTQQQQSQQLLSQQSQQLSTPPFSTQNKNTTQPR